MFGEELPTEGYVTAKLFTSYAFTRGGLLNTVTARLDNAGDTLYRNHLNYLKDLLPEAGRSFKVVYALGFSEHKDFFSASSSIRQESGRVALACPDRLGPPSSRRSCR